MNRVPVASLAALIRRLFEHLGRRRRWELGLLFALTLVSTFAEVVSLGAVLPFLGVLTAPEKVFHHPLAANVVRALRITSPEELVLPVTIAFAVGALAAGGIRLLLHWASTRFAFACGADLSIEMYRRTLYQPYQVHVSRNSAGVISGMTNKTFNVAFGVLVPLLTLMSAGILVFAVFFTMLAIDAFVALLATIGFGASYGLVTWLFSKQLKRNSRRIAQETTQVLKSLQEALGGIRDVLLNGTQQVYCNIYRQADQPLRRAQGNNAFIGGSPRFAVEALAIAVIAALSYGLSRRDGGIAAALPTLGAMALGAQRLLPALQNCYAAWASIVGNEGSLADMIDLLDQPMPDEMFLALPAPLSFKESIRLEAVSYRYENSEAFVINGLSLTIRKGSRVGFVGTTGSGKSTTLDLLMGLLTPTHGQILVDGRPVEGVDRRAWQRNIAHVPQNIFLADASFAANIAFGVPSDGFDMERIRRAARQAQIADFIESQPDAYETFVGERGARLSGGQRQRIGIARALYKQASVLAFDEATSALDNPTEREVMDAIANLDRDLTIVLIAHRLTTVQGCDTIFELADGRLVAQGSYEQLRATSPSFREMARTA